MSEKVSEQPAPEKYRRDFDWMSSLSFLGAAVLGAFAVANDIRSRFFKVFIDGYGGETETPFTPLLREYRGDPAKGGEGGKFRPIVEAYKKGDLTPTEYSQRMRQTAKEFRHAVDSRVEKEFGIPANGLKGWTVGTVKRWQHLGIIARRDATLGFATVAAVGVGAIGVLKHSKDTIDRIEDKLDEQQGRSR